MKAGAILAHQINGKGNKTFMGKETKDRDPSEEKKLYNSISHCSEVYITGPPTHTTPSNHSTLAII